MTGAIGEIVPISRDATIRNVAPGADTASDKLDVMENNSRELLILHGAVVMAVGLVFGLAAVMGVVDDAFDGWRAAHLSVIMMGIWMLAMSGVFPVLVLLRREASVLLWSLVASGYGVIIVSAIKAVAGVKAISPDGPAANWIAFGVNMVVVLGASLAVLLTIKGAMAALKRPGGD